MRRLFAAALAFAAAPAQAQEIWLMPPEVEARFDPGALEPRLAPGFPPQAEWLIHAFSNRKDVRVAWIATPGDRFAMERGLALVDGIWRDSWPQEAARGLVDLQDERVQPDRLRLGLQTNAAADPICQAWELEVSDPEVFGESRVRLPVVAFAALPAGARITARLRGDPSGAAIGPFGPPALLALSQTEGRLLDEEGAGRGVANPVGADRLDAPPPEAIAVHEGRVRNISEQLHTDRLHAPPPQGFSAPAGAGTRDASAICVAEIASR